MLAELDRVLRRISAIRDSSKNSPRNIGDGNINRTYVDTYERRPSSARGRSISLSSLRGHRVATTPLRRTHVAVVAGGEVSVEVADVASGLQGVASEEKRLSLAYRLRRGHMTQEFARRFDGSKEKEKPEWLSVACQATKSRPENWSILRAQSLRVSWSGGASRCAWEEERQASGVREVEQRRRVVRRAFLVKSRYNNRQRRSAVTRRKREFAVDSEQIREPPGGPPR
ncbi:hypothetical protein PUN28_000751 [Cardiocondyla obscurior]|uniref:Uncharacterized protein n=1 Tax=Cardiocondyla obscurior TaxID=286306 RepID=A0AAW2H0V3_9HYME